MSVETYQGKIKNGQIKLAVSVELPENKKVYVIVPGEDEKPKFDLAEMAQQMPKDYEPFEEDFGKPVGKEVW
jgi:antitoxin component of MazEF toxin-antitoxin module